MKIATRAKGLGHLPTVTSKHIRATPAQRGTAYLDMYLLDTEERRLEQEMAHLEERRRRNQRRRTEIREKMTLLRGLAQQEEVGLPPGGASPAAGAEKAESTPAAKPRWRTLPAAY
ncbi:MAG: hypothetical protein HYY21_05615 [Candidatus Tectomicrobia bacterium]|nr:hypothetical protein [Candidatus Tectomicrobia bacterium]